MIWAATDEKFCNRLILQS